MYDRSWLDPIPFYPSEIICALFIGFTACSYWYNKKLQSQGIYNDSIYPGRAGILFIFFVYVPLNILSIFIPIYLIYIFGWKVFGLILFIAISWGVAFLMGLLPYSHYILPVLSLLFGIMLLDWFNILDIHLIKLLNKLLFSIAN